MINSVDHTKSNARYVLAMQASIWSHKVSVKPLNDGKHNNITSLVIDLTGCELDKSRVWRSFANQSTRQ